MTQSELHDMQHYDLLGRRQAAHRAFDIEPQIDRMTLRWALVDRVTVTAFRSRWPFSAGLKEAGIGDAVEPGGKAGLAAKLVQFAPCQQERLLSKIVGSGIVAMK